MSNYINGITNYIERGQFKRLDEAQLFIHYGKELDSISYKFKAYNNGHLNNKINESISVAFTPAESVAISNVFLNFLEEYKQTLLNEQNIYEQYLNGELIISEGVLSDLSNSIKNVINKGTQTVKNVLNDISTKIVELTKFIKDLLKNGIKSIKEFGDKFFEVVNKCKISNVSVIVEKIGLDPDKIEKSFVQDNDELIKNADKIKKDCVYESLGNEINNLILEAKEENTDNVVAQKLKKSGGWKKVFLDLLKWLLPCLVLPALAFTVMGTGGVPVLIYTILKLLYQCYSIYLLYKQFLEIKKKWNTLKPASKVVNVIIFIIALVSLAMGLKNSLLDLTKIGSVMLNSFSEFVSGAGLGIQPDPLVKGLTSLVKCIKEGKFPNWENLTAAYDGLTKSFAKSSPDIPLGGSGGNTNSSGSYEDVKKALGSNNSGDMPIIDKAQGVSIDLSSVPDDKIVGTLASGMFDESNKWTRKVIEALKEYGLSTEEIKQIMDSAKPITDEALNAKNSLSGTMTYMQMQGKVAKYLISKGLLGQNGHGFVVGIVSKAQEVYQTIHAMSAALPFVRWFNHYKGGFRVRLGSEETDNYIYEIGPKGIRTEDFDDESKIKDVIEESKKYYNHLKDEVNTKEEKDKLEEEFKKFTETFKEDYKKIKRVVFYGTRVKEDKEKNESLSYIPFTEYIFEKKEYNIKNPDKETIFKNLQDLRKLIESFCKPYTKETDANGKKLIKKADTTLAGSTQIILRSLFSTSEKNKTSKFEFDKNFDDTEDSKKSIRKRALTKETTDDKFGPKDIYTLAVFLSKHAFDDCSVDDINEALIDVVLIKNQLNKSSDVSDRIKMLYINIVKNFSKSDKFKEKIADEWKPGKNWAPLKFDIDDIDDDTKKEVEKAENNLLPSEEEKEEVEEKVEDQDKPEEKKEDDKKEDDKKEEDKKEDGEKDGEEEIAVLEFIPFFECYDIADANKKGPRKDPYSFKGSFLDLEFIEIIEGTPKADIEEVLGDLLYTMVNNCYSLIADKPFIKESDKKFIVNKNSLYQANEERPELGYFTNEELTDIINNKDNAKKYLNIPTSKFTVAKTAREKEQITELEKINNEKLKNNKELQKIRPELFDEDDNIKEKEWKEFNKGLANYQLGKKKEEKKSGIFKKAFNKAKNLFGFNKSDFEKADKLLKKDKKTNESIEEVFKKPISLTSYLKENLN